MKQAARNIAGARVDTTARISSIRRQGGDGDVNFADVWPTITRVGARRAEPKQEEGWRIRVAPPRETRVAPLGSTQESSERVRVAPPGSVRAAPPGRVRGSTAVKTWSALSYVYLESTTMEGCHGTRPDEHNT